MLSKEWHIKWDPPKTQCKPQTLVRKQTNGQSFFSTNWKLKHTLDDSKQVNASANVAIERDLSKIERNLGEKTPRRKVALESRLIT